MPPARLLVVTLTAIACHGALAQTAVPPALVVQRLAPQLVAFAGSEANFQSLVNGLAQGTAVQISSALPNGFTQAVTFTPAAPMTPAQIAQVLEGARQQLIGLGIPYYMWASRTMRGRSGTEGVIESVNGRR